MATWLREKRRLAEHILLATPLLWCLFGPLLSPKPVCAAPPATRPAATPDTALPRIAPRLRLLEANIRLASPADGNNDWPFRRAGLAEQIRQLDPDLIALQEVSPAQNQYLLQELPAWHSATPPADQSSLPGQGLWALWHLVTGLTPIYFRSERFELLEASAGLLRPDAPQPSATENALISLARLRDRKHLWPDLLVLNLHLRHDKANAQAGARRILDILAQQRVAHPDIPALVMGDFNQDQTGRAYQILTVSGGLLDTFDYRLRPAAENWGNWHAFTGRSNRRFPSDLIFVTPPIGFQPARLLRKPLAEGRYPSDHFFVTTEIFWP